MVMAAHSLTTTPAASAATSITTKSKNTPTTLTHSQSLGCFRRVVASCHGHPYPSSQPKLVSRRTVSLSLTAAVLGLNIGDQSASSAARRPPAPPPVEKKDPNVSGLQAKVQASKKRKEALKEYVAKLREKGEAINQPSE